MPGGEQTEKRCRPGRDADAARRYRDAIRLKRKGETVWEAASTRQHSPDDPYYFFGLPRKEPNP